MMEMGVVFVVLVTALALAGEAANQHEAQAFWAWLISLFIEE
jgi:hypothetical protein